MSMNSFKQRWTLSFSKELMNNTKPNSWEISSILLNADSKTVVINLLKQNQLPNSQQLLRQIKEKKLRISKIGHLVSEMLSQLSLLKMDSQLITLV